MLISLGRGSSPPANKQNRHMPLDKIISSCLFDVDATLSKSYAGSGALWKNIVTNPADGTPPSAYLFYLGAAATPTAATPSFIGTADAPSAYFECDGVNDTIALAGTNTTFLNNLPKTTGGSLPVTMALAFRSTLETVGRVYMGAWQGSFPALRLQFSSGQTLRFQHGGGGTFSHSDGLTMPAGKDYVAILSLNSDGEWQAWVNGRKTTGIMPLVPTTENAGHFRIMNTVGAGLRLYSASLFNTVLSDQQAERLLQTYRNRHQRPYQD